MGLKLNHIDLPVSIASRGPSKSLPDLRKVFGLDDWIKSADVAEIVRSDHRFAKELGTEVTRLFSYPDTLNLESFAMFRFRMEAKLGRKRTLRCPFVGGQFVSGDHLVVYTSAIKPRLARALPHRVGRFQVVGGVLSDPNVITAETLQSTDLRAFREYLEIVSRDNPHLTDLGWTFDEILAALVDAKLCGLDFFTYVG